MINDKNMGIVTPRNLMLFLVSDDPLSPNKRRIKKKENSFQRNLSTLYCKGLLLTLELSRTVSVKPHEHVDLNNNCNTEIKPDSKLRCLSRDSFTISACVRSLLLDLVSREKLYHPNNAFLFYVNPQVEDKVNATLRNEAIFNLRFLHNGYFNLSAATFSKAVNLVDRFIIRVKVKPRYMTCVTAACYYIAAKQTELPEDTPSAETLVQITHCGGTSADLKRMEEIILSKLNRDVNSVTALDVITTITNLPSSGNITQCLGSAVARLQIALCSLEIYHYKPSCLAFACLSLVEGLGVSIPKLKSAAKLCGMEWCEVQLCAELVNELYDDFYSQKLQSSRAHLVWPVSRRTRPLTFFSLHTSLSPIPESSESLIIL